MRNAAGELRVASVEVLNTVGLPHNAKAYDTFASKDAVFPRVIIESITGGGPAFSKCGWGGDWFVNMKVSDRFRGDVSRNVIDSIVNEIFVSLCPKGGPFINMLNFTVWSAEGTVLSTLSYYDNVDKYIDTNIQIRYRITQNDSNNEN